MARRRVGDVWLVSRVAGSWVSEDGRFEVRKFPGGYSECENDHPVKISRELASWARGSPSVAGAGEVLSALREGRRGFVCPAGSEHQLPDVWEVWDRSIDDYVGREPVHAATFGEACARLAEYRGLDAPGLS